MVALNSTQLRCDFDSISTIWSPYKTWIVCMVDDLLITEIKFIQWFSYTPTLV